VEEGAEVVFPLIIMEKTVEVEEVLGKTEIVEEAAEGMEYMVKVIVVHHQPMIRLQPPPVEVEELLLLRQPLMVVTVYL
jgi:hypothetical protein